MHIFLAENEISFWDIFNPVEFVRKLIGFVVDAIVKEIVDAIGQWVVDSLVDFIKAPTKMTKPFNVDLQGMFEFFQNTAFALLMIFFMIRIMNGLKDNLTGENEPNFAEILGSFVIATGLIFATPYILEKFLVPANNAIIQEITEKYSNVKLEKGAEFSTVVNLDEVDIDIWAKVVLRIVMLIVFIFFVIAGAIRYVELILLYFIGPLIATTYINRSDLYRSYWLECIAVVFTQALHFFLLALALNLLKDGIEDDISKVILAVAVVVVGVRGPQVLRQYIYSTGSTGIVSQVAKVVTMVKMSRK